MTFSLLLTHTGAIPSTTDTMSIKYEEYQQFVTKFGSGGEIDPSKRPQPPTQPTTPPPPTTPQPKIKYLKSVHSPLQGSDGTEPPVNDTEEISPLDQIEVVSTFYQNCVSSTTPTLTITFAMSFADPVNNSAPLDITVTMGDNVCRDPPTFDPTSTTDLYPTQPAILVSLMPNYNLPGVVFNRDMDMHTQNIMLCRFYQILNPFPLIPSQHPLPH